MQRNNRLGGEQVVAVRVAARGIARVVGVLGLCWLVMLVGDARAQGSKAPGIQLLDLVDDAPRSVQAGTTLTLRVQLAIALTPPPGVQRSRALREWSAELTGDAHHVVGADLGAANVGPAIDHRYPIDVINVRPETATSLVYRVQLAIPGWVAPTTYALRLAGPGGVASLPRSVRVTPVGNAGAANVGAPHDDGGRWIGLRAGERLSTVPNGWPKLTWYPGTSLLGHAVAPSVVAWIPASAAAAETDPDPRLKVTASLPLKLKVVAEPPPRAGQVSTLIARGLPTGAQVAWSLSDGTHALGPAQLDHLFRASGRHVAHVLAIAPDGSAASVEAALDVQPGLRFGCSVSGTNPHALGWRTSLAALCPLILALALLKRRPRTTPGIN